MTTKTLSGAYPGGYAVAGGVTRLDIDTAAMIGGAGISAIGQLVIYNFGANITAADTATGVYLQAGGRILNKAGATIYGGNGVEMQGGYEVVENYGTIAANAEAVAFYGASGLVVNHGLIVAGTGVTINAGAIENYATIQGGAHIANAGGTVVNGDLKHMSAAISGQYAVLMGGGALHNFGNLSGYLIGAWAGNGSAPTSIVNGAVGDRTASIVGSTGVRIDHGSLANFGTIIGTLASGAYINDGGTVTNGALAGPESEIVGYTGVEATAAASVTNYGLVLGTALAGYAGIALKEGGDVVNGGVTDTAARIQGFGGIEISGAAGTVVNLGTVVGTGGEGSPAIALSAGGQVHNGSGADTAASIQGWTGVDVGVYGTVVNFGRIDGLAGYGVVMRGVGSVTNGGGIDTTAVVQGYVGVDLKDGGVLTNAGTILSTSAYGLEAVYLSGGAMTNGSQANGTALVEGYDGLRSFDATVTNFGTIVALGDSGYGVVTGAAATLTNAGLIEGNGGLQASSAATVINAGTIAGLGGVAMRFQSPACSLVVEAGSKFVGAVLGDGGTLVLANGAGTLQGLFSTAGVTVAVSTGPTAFQGFDMVQVSSGDAFTDFDANTTIGASDTLVDDGALTLAGAIANAGQIDLDSAGLTVAAAGLTISGTGTVVMSNSAANLIAGAAGGSTLTVGEVLEGAGKLGGGEMTLAITAAGSVKSTGSSALIINTGADTIANSGKIYASGTGGLTVVSAIANAGVLCAYASTLTVDGAVTGNGHAQIDTGTLKFTAASAFNQNVTFSGTGGTLALAHAQNYSAAISGFSTAGNTYLDLADISFVSGVTKASYSGTAAGGVLTVTDGTHTAKLHFNGNYTASTWILSAAAGGGTMIVDPAKYATPAVPALQVSDSNPGGSAFIQAMATLGAQRSGETIAMVREQRGDGMRLIAPPAPLS